MTDLISLEGVSVDIPTDAGVLRAMDSVSFSMRPGEVVGLVGESGSGKSMTARSILRILPETAKVTGSITFDGVDIVSADERAVSKIRGSRIAMVFQEPGASLNPVIRIGKQLREVLRLHQGLRGATARSAAEELLRQVGIPEPKRRLAAYPHELSGGMKQRVSIAIALACDPELLIADEPTTALDVTIQAQVLELLRDLVAQRGASLLLISHDLGVVGQVTDRTLVMYAGRVVEEGPTAEVLSDPTHPYTKALLNAAPSKVSPKGTRLTEIEGQVADLISRPSGCAFHPRCPEALASCSVVTPGMTRFDPERAVACVLQEGK